MAVSLPAPGAELPAEIGAALLLEAADAILGVDADGAIAIANPAAERLFGYAPGRLTGRPVEELVPSALRDAHRRHRSAFASAPAARPMGPGLELAARRADGTDVPVEISLSPLMSAWGPMTVCVVRDISERRALERELSDSRRRLQEAEELARIGSWEWDIQANVVTWSDELFRIYGLEPGAEEPSYERFLAYVHPDDREDVDARNRKAFGDQQPFEDVKRVIRADGTEILMRTQGEVVVAPDGTLLRMIGVCEDVTAEVQAEQALARLAGIIESSSDAIFSKRLDGTITSWNAAAERLYGFTAEEIVGQRADVLVPPGRVDEEDRLLAQIAAGERVDHYDTRRRRKDGTTIAVSLTLSPVTGPNGQVVGASAISRDVTERKHFEAEIRHLADHDALTGLWNRGRFEEELEIELERLARYEGTAGVIVLDLDSFKYVNASFGAHVGDELIRSVARALRDTVGSGDALARLGGDEFAVLLREVPADALRETAEALVSVVRHHGFAVGGERVRSSASIGAVLIGDAAASAEEVLAACERAMYGAKDGGRDRVVIGELAAAQAVRPAGVSWEHHLRRALEGEGFLLECQPIVDLERNVVSQYELLLRLAIGDRVVPPDDFLGIADRLGLAGAIDRWVVRSAIALLADHRSQGRRLELEVNLSARSLGDAELTSLIADEIVAARIDPAQLVFEITETAAIANMADARRAAELLRSIGCRFALDDFGTGFSSFSYLKHLPLDFVKIDGDFIRSPRSRTDEVILESIVSVSRGMGKRTIAEYVGDEETLDLLRRIGVDFAQGFHCGRPFPVAELAQRAR